MTITRRGYREFSLPADEHGIDDPPVECYGATFWHGGKQYGVTYKCLPGSSPAATMWRLVRERVQLIRDAVDSGQAVNAPSILWDVKP